MFYRQRRAKGGTPGFYGFCKSLFFGAQLALAGGLVPGITTTALAFVTLDTSSPVSPSKTESDTVQASDSIPAKIPAKAPAAPVTGSPTVKPASQLTVIPALKLTAPQTSIPDSMDKIQNVLSPLKTPTSSQVSLPHYPVVLFLSADDYEVYTALGIMAALQDYGLKPDALVGESKAALVAAAWALGYSAENLASQVLNEPYDAWVLPYSRKGSNQPASHFKQEERRPFALTLAGHSLQGDRGRWQDGTLAESQEFLHVSWLFARLTEGAPTGSVAQLEKTPVPLALQVFDAENGALRVLTQGDLQDLLKASLLPVPVARERSNLRPFSDGAQVSGHDAFPGAWPFRFDRVIALRLSSHLKRRMFGGYAPSWRDSLAHGFQEGKRNRLDSLARAGRVDFIDIVSPDNQMSESTPADWRDMGYQAALRHMDLLLKSMRKNEKPAVKPPAPSAQEVQITIDPLASGGRELLLDLLQENPLNERWESGQKAMNAVMATGFYNQLDVTWQPETPTEGEQWVFSAKEQSKLQIWGAPRLLITHEALSMRAPQIMGGISWSEPLFIPLKFEFIADMGGRQPGWALQAFVQPLSPLPLRAGVRHWQIDMHHLGAKNFPFEPSFDAYGLSPYRMREKQSRLFLDLMPDGLLRLQSDVGMRHLRFGLEQDVVDSLRTLFEGIVEACLGCAPRNNSSIGAWLPSLQTSFRRAETVSEGQVKPLHDIFTARSEMHAPLAKVFSAKAMVEYVWSNYSPRETDLYDLYTGPEIDALSFGDQFFFLSAKALNFWNGRIEALPRWGGFQGRFTYGWVRHMGPTLFGSGFNGQESSSTDTEQQYWEINLSYPTPVGPIRLGIGRFDDFDTLVALQLGVNLNLARALRDSRL